MPGFPDPVRQLVYLRASYRCELCRESAEGGSVHHRRPRGMGGDKRPETSLASNALLLCGSGTTKCHGWVESHRDHALLLGLLIPKGSPILPADIPVALGHGIGSVWLTDDGQYRTTPPEGVTP